MNTDYLAYNLFCMRIMFALFLLFPHFLILSSGFTPNMRGVSSFLRGLSCTLSVLLHIMILHQGVIDVLFPDQTGYIFPPPPSKYFHPTTASDDYYLMTVCFDAAAAAAAAAKCLAFLKLTAGPTQMTPPPTNVKGYIHRVGW